MPLPVPDVQQQYHLMLRMRNERLTEDETWVRDTATLLIHRAGTYGMGVHVAPPVWSRYVPDASAYPRIDGPTYVRIQLGGFLNRRSHDGHRATLEDSDPQRKHDRSDELGDGHARQRA